MELRRLANEIYDAKMRSGFYEDYDERAKELLYEDCVKQAILIKTCRQLNEEE